MLLDYESLKLVWWVLIGILFIGFALTDGFDMGVGALLRVVGKTDEERRVAINTIAPHWDGNQVWLILAAGAIFAAWPITFGAAFSSFYWAMVLTLFSLFFRPIGFDYRSKLASPAWRNLWDWGLVVAGVVPPLVIGVAFGNLLLGVPFAFDEYMRLTSRGSFFALFHPFAILVGIVSLLMFMMQGATYLMLRTDEKVYQRAQSMASLTALGVMVSFTLAGLWLWLGVDGYMITQMPPTDALPNPLNKVVVPTEGAWLTNYTHYPLAITAPTLGLLGALTVFALAKAGRAGWSFVFSSLSIIGIILTAGVSLFPFVMPSSLNPNHSLTVWDSASSHLTLNIMLWAALIFVPLILIYTLWCYRMLWGKITLAFIRSNDHTAY
ncbi:cytochrome d ubiquinol oxidase subunit II [Thiothrix eikelboomii]|uniref:Cytochrome d ubiquinol oxidase subunit II n=1 Tax=Thiothrix eikelboomii TaxID=92487 RepID=A0A1T4W5C3_9GAMM|nr:cytochrome d ubiquinol oxidase subunit II [Thiothrix eikelboomii]SKA71891.1 cytochrome d ubiquinol oxidase subunit II [Thiothrix eikelboomii]